jgi:hypothetical protein
MKNKLLMSLALTALLLGSLSCSSDPTGSGGGNLSILLTDAPIDLTLVDEVRVVLDEFLIYPADDSAPIALAIHGGELITVNLLDYQNGAVVLVADGGIPAGEYLKVRMGVLEATLVTDDDDDPLTPALEEPIFLPSGKVDIPVTFSISIGEDLSLTLDFDAERSVQVNSTNGNHTYILRPVVVPVTVEPN